MAGRRSDRGGARGPAQRVRPWDVDPELVGTALRMLAYFSAFVVITMFIVPAPVRIAVQEATAAASAALVGWIGIEVTRQGTQLLLPGITLVVDWACTAVTVLTLYIALLLAYSTTARLKAQGIALGTTVIVVANQIRILGTAAVAQYWPSALHAVHDYLFQLSMVIVVVILWMWWLGLVNRVEANDE